MTPAELDTGLLRQALEDAWAWRENRVVGYWCECDSEPQRCTACQTDADWMAKYQAALATLDGAS